MPNPDHERAHRVALFYRSLGLCPLPSAVENKQPVIEYRRHLRGEPVPECTYCQWPTPNVQLITGTTTPTPVRLVVVDCDGVESKDKWAQICRNHGQVAPSRTWKSKTGSGVGFHVYYRLPDGHSRCPSRMLWGLWDTYGADGKGCWAKHKEIRLLADDRLCVAPPSIHVDTGQRYQFCEGFSPKEIPLPAVAPDWLLSMPGLRSPRMIAAAEAKPTTIFAKSAKPGGYSRNEVLEAIKDKLDLVESWGLRITGRPDESGWVSCRAPGREDRNPSGSFNVESGVFMDWATGDSCALFTLAVSLGAYKSWVDCLNHCGDRYLPSFGVASSANHSQLPGSPGPGQINRDPQARPW